MPPDTSYIPGVTVPPLFSDSIPAGSILLQRPSSGHPDSLKRLYLQASEPNAPHYLLPEWQMFIAVLIIVYLLVLRPIFKQRKEVRERIDLGHRKIDGREMQFDCWLTKYNPYYSSLTAEEKKRFLLRTIDFMLAKEFRFHSMVEEEYIPVLISGAAVQLTFGMKNYLIDYFPVIHIIRKEYTLNVDKETYYGHVSRNGIYISWSRFMEGYNDYDDSVNVGLHEMAHAISFDVFLGQQDEQDLQFRERLETFKKNGRPVFRALKQGASHILDDYAATNFDEFWAVCVETFFENAAEFQRTMPDLYLTICDLLNQDPLRADKIISRELAGLAN